MKELDSYSFFRHLHLGHVLVWEFHRFEDVCHLEMKTPQIAGLQYDREQVIDPSYIVVEDELMSSWISRKQDCTI